MARDGNKKKASRRARPKTAVPAADNSVLAFLARTGVSPVDKPAPTPARALLGAARREDLLADEPPPELKVAVTTPTDGKERAARRPFSARVELRAAVAGLSAVARTTNVSRSGVFVETTELLDVGEALVLSFPDKDGPGVRVHGRVRWTTPFGTIEDPRPGMGVEFTGLDDQKRARLLALLDEREGSDG